MKRSPLQALPARPIGIHAPLKGGFAAAVRWAAARGCTALALFTRSPRTYRISPLPSAADAAAFREALDAAHIAPHHCIPHGCYLVNVCSERADVRTKSRAVMCDELRRCDVLGLPWLNVHPGSPGKAAAGKEAEMARAIDDVAEAVADCLRTEGIRCGILFENTAGGGATLGRTFEELRALLDKVQEHDVALKERLGVTLDTCHLLAAGYDVRTKEGLESVLDEFDRVVGLQWLRLVHVNDSKCELGSRRDRHETLGKGFLGEAAFDALVNEPRLAGVPLVLETPHSDVSDDMALLRRLAGEQEFHDDKLKLAAAAAGKEK